MHIMHTEAIEEVVRVGTAAGSVVMDADLRMPQRPAGLAILAHGGGGGRFSRRNLAVANVLEEAGIASLLLDLLTPGEESVDRHTGQYRFDMTLLGRRVIDAADWSQEQPELRSLPIMFFGASTGAAAALIAAAERPELVRAVVSRGGRLDLAGDALARVQAPALLIVGNEDDAVVDLNRQAMHRFRAPVELKIVSGATHPFEERSALEQVAQLAATWFRPHLWRDAA